MPRDPYDILGVPRSATPEQIREAHRKLAKKFHPDLNKTAEAGAKFKEIQEAYDLLSDAQKRKQFDQFGHAGPSMGGAPGGAQGGWGNVDASTFEEIFGDFMGGGARRAGGRRGGARAGEDLESRITVDFMTAALGGVRHVSLESNGQPISLDVRIPPGIESGGDLRLRGKGGEGMGGGPAGDLVLHISVAPHPWFRREGLDVIVEVPISIAECALGTSVEVPLLEGTATLRVPAGTASGKRLRLKGKGVAAKGDTGDLYALIRVEAPKTLNDEDRAALERMKATEPDPRADAPWNAKR
ncbi:MAG: DnaJ domain-containing protein [Planctomycetaceae bacterium]|jgi:DnaJ-class molecular chaperone|nr:DnaJ domain-containing protein [Planctomycetaceae bacterium]